MDKDNYIIFGNNFTSITLPKLGEEYVPRVSAADNAFNRGEQNATNYTEAQIMDMLKYEDYEAIFEALGAIGKRKLKRALPCLKNLALYDEDITIQLEAIRTIRKIGGKKAIDILRFLKTTEHYDYIEEILLSGVQSSEDYF